jgi:hypothetical protein
MPLGPANDPEYFELNVVAGLREEIAPGSANDPEY